MTRQPRIARGLGPRQCHGSVAFVENVAEPAGERLGLPGISGVFGGEAAMVTREHDRLRPEQLCDGDGRRGR